MATTKTPTIKTYPIDTGAISFAVSIHASNQFRIVAHLDEEIDVELLQQAVDLSMLRYPMYNVNYCKGKGCVLKVCPTNSRIVVQPYSLQFAPININSDEPKVKVYYKPHAIAVEIYHTISDANGALNLLNTIIACYQRLQGNTVDEDGVIPYDSPINADEYCDGYDKFAEKGKTKINTVALNSPLQLEGNPLSIGVNETFYKIVIDAKDLKKVKDEYKATVHEFLVTMLYLTYLQIKDKYKSKKEIRIQMPINMRAKFNTPTLRNFVASVQFSTGEKTFNGILKEVKSFLALATSERESKSFLYKGKTLISKVLPMLPSFFGKFCVRTGSKLLGDKSYSTNLSNLGIVRNNLQGVKGYDFIIAPPRYGSFCTSCTGYKNYSTMIISRHVDNDEFEKEFLLQLAKFDIIPIRAEYLV